MSGVLFHGLGQRLDSDDSDDDKELNERKGTFIGHDFHRDVGTVSTTHDEFARG